MEAAEIQRNKAIRGYVIRSLVKGRNNCLLVKQVANLLINSGLVYSEDIGKYLEYLAEAGYIEFTDKKITAFSAYREDAIIKLTRKGVDLVEGTIDDPGVDV
ncbi:MAG: hypothetical protein ACI4LO_02015 [Anaerovoracaceae bacterium]